MNRHFDYIIIGSGFGGSVSALRLAEKGYSVAVLEKGRRFGPGDFARTNWNIRKFLWAPFLKCFGIQNITLFRNVFVLSGVGVGGGSLVYANTLVQPDDLFFTDPAWSDLADWRQELTPHYEMARKMLGAARNTHFSAGDKLLKCIGDELGCGQTFSSVDVAIYFGEPNREVVDPYFGGTGPKRSGCTFCGGCMVGCRFNAKNTLDKNYLYLAEKLGVQIFAETEVMQIIPEQSRYRLSTRSSTKWFGRTHQNFTAKNVVCAGGVLGTVKLLLENKYIHKTLPRISDRLGRQIRTNGESLGGVTDLSTAADYTDGVAISSSIKPDPKTKIEVVRYSQGSGFMRLLAMPIFKIKPFTILFRSLRMWIKKDWAARTIILLTMQQNDTQIALGIRRRWYKFFFKSFGAFETDTHKIETNLPIAHKAIHALNQKIAGVPQIAFSEVLFKIPATAHILGGACIGSTPQSGVIDARGRVYNYPGLYVVDGSVIPANLGVNPSLTITALAEYMMAQVQPNH